nr:hypothetical protein [Methylococcus capsulatus]
MRRHIGPTRTDGGAGRGMAKNAARAFTRMGSPHLYLKRYASMG